MNRWMLLATMLLVSACGDGPYKCVYEKSVRGGQWEDHCQTFWPDDVLDPDTFCDKYEGHKTHSVKPADTVYITSADYRYASREEGACEPGDGKQ